MTSKTLLKTLCLATSALCSLTVVPAIAKSPKTPIEHVIIIVGENHTFDNLFGTLQSHLSHAAYVRAACDRRSTERSS